MEERKSFIEKYASNKTSKKRKLKLPKLTFPKINHELAFKYFVFIVTIITIFTSYCMYLDNAKKYMQDDYTIIDADHGLTILLNKKTGSTYRNIFCDNKEKIPNCWDSMKYDIPPGFELDSN